MKKIYLSIKKFLINMRGIAIQEYSIGLAIIGLAIIIGTNSSGSSIRNKLICIATGASCNNEDK